MSVESLEALESNLLNSKELQNASNEELDGMLPSYFADTKENREYIQGLVNERISTKRKISKQMYTKKNVERIEKLGIEESDLEFVSSYSPMIIGEMTESEVEDIIINSNVKSIDYDADVEISAEDVEMNTNAASTVAAASSTPSQQDLYVNIWKSAVNVDYTINTLGLKGEGINVGLQDIDSVTGNHGELKDTNITVIDKIANYDGAHGDFCTRILAGSNGIVSKANIYTNNIANGSFTGIEELIDQGVSIISISIAYNFKTGPQYYSYIEQWYDYICKNSGVVIVTAAGNLTEKYGDIVSQGGLSYNVITVGGIDVKNTFDKAKHTFWNGTCTVNGGNSGCAKPDVEAPATGVFGSGGTSGATPIVAGICAQIIEAKPTLAFYPEIVKAIILASCDRKGKGGESYTDGLTAKEGSGVVNAQIAVTIASATRYISGTWSKSNDGVGRTVYLPKKIRLYQNCIGMDGSSCNN